MHTRGYRWLRSTSKESRHPPALADDALAVRMCAYRGVMMPRRKQTRQQNRRDRVNKERRQRIELIAEEERQHQAWLAATTNHHRSDVRQIPVNRWLVRLTNGSIS